MTQPLDSAGHSYAFRVSGRRAEVTRGRRRVLGVVRSWGYPISEDALVWVALLAGELIADAVHSVGGRTIVAVRWTGRRIRVEVCGTTPVMDHPDGQPDEAWTRRLQLLDSLATTWGRFSHPLGKVTWFEIGEPYDWPLPPHYRPGPASPTSPSSGGGMGPARRSHRTPAA